MQSEHFLVPGRCRCPKEAVSETLLQHKPQLATATEMKLRSCQSPQLWTLHARHIIPAPHASPTWSSLDARTAADGMLLPLPAAAALALVLTAVMSTASITRVLHGAA